MPRNKDVMSKKADLVKNTLILGLGKLSTQFVSFILLPIYTIFLSPEQFGAVDLIISYIVLLAPLIMLQLDRAAFRMLIDARGDEVRGKIVISNVLRIVLPVLLVAGLSFGVVGVFVQIPHAPLIVMAIILTIFSSLFLQFARGFGKNTLFAIASILSGLVNLAASAVLVVLLGLGVEGVLWSTITANLILVGYLFITLRLYRFISFASLTDSRAIRKELIDFAWPLVPSAVSWWFIRTFDRTLVTMFLGLAANGVYAAANRYSLILNALYSIFDLSWTESASAHINSKDRDKFFSDVYNTSFRFFGALGLVMIAITPFIFGAIIGGEFQEAYLYIPVLILGALFNAAVSQYSVIYIAKKKTKQILVTSILAAVISVALNLALIPLLGIMGAALSNAIAFLVMTVWRHFDIKRYVTVTFTGNLFVKLLLAYGVTISLYYVGNIYVSVINLAIAGIIAFLLSQTMLAMGFKKAIAKMNGMKIRRS